MNKDEILKMSRKENEGKPDEWERYVVDKASKISKIAALLICLFLYGISLHFHDDWIAGIASIIYFGMSWAEQLVLFWYKRKLRFLVFALLDMTVVILSSQNLIQWYLR